MDESGSHDGAPKLCIAGFVFEADEAVKLDAEWREVLVREKIPYMRMSQFTKDGCEPYAHLSRSRRIEIEKELIAIIRKHRSLAFASGISETMYSRVCADYFPMPHVMTAYTWCLIDCEKLVEMWARDHNLDGQIAYYFESGHKHQGLANRAWDKLFSDEDRRKRFRYGSHSFIDKADAGALQAADMLAYLACKWFGRGLPGTVSGMRKDLQQLLVAHHPRQMIALHWWEEDEVRERLVRYLKIMREAGYEIPAVDQK